MCSGTSCFSPSPTPSPRSEHPLAQLYCHSIMEHHHFDQCLMILNSPVSTVFIVVNLKGELYKCSFIFRFWTYSQHHKFSNILYSFLGKEGIAKAVDIATASRLAGKNYLVLPAKDNCDD